MGTVEEELRARWEADLGGGRRSRATFDALCGRYREPTRRYHSLVHVLRVLRAIGELSGRVAVADPAAVRLAGWYHDAIYDPRSGTNEADSATLATDELTALGCAEHRVTLVGELVRATADHRPGSVTDPVAAAVLIDADLAVLAADPRAYQAYVDGVRAEYAHLDDGAWRRGRSAVLRGLAGRERLFHVEPIAEREATARANIAAELARWNRRRDG